MLLAQAQPVFFPPWYFWVFVLGVVLVVIGGLVTMIVSLKRAECALRIKERELAAHLMEVMLQQVLNSYWRLGSFWGRFRQLWNTARPTADSLPPQKELPAWGIHK